MNQTSKLLKFELVAVFLLFMLSRLPSLGNDTFNTDSWKWKARIYNFGSGVFNLHFEDTIQKYHPGVTLMWIGTGTIKGYNLFYDFVYKHPPIDNDIKTVFEINFVEKLGIVLVLATVFSSIYYVLFNLFGRRYAVIALLLLGLEPFYAGLSREIHLEGLMSAFILASFVWLYYAAENKYTNFALFLSGVFGALAVLTKTTALIVVPFSFLVLFLHSLYASKKLGRSFSISLTPYVKWIMIFVLFFNLLWPAMWVTPSTALQTLYNGVVNVGIDEGHDQLYFGKLLTNPGLGFYFVVLLIKSSVYLLFGVLGYFLFAARTFDKKSQRFAVTALLLAILYLLEISIPSKKIDRYIVPSMLSLLLVGAFFYEWLLLKAKKFYNIFILILFAPAILLFASILPDYFSYYNPFTGGLKTGITVLEPKWLIGGKEVAAYFEKVKKDENLLPFDKDENMESMLKSSALSQRLTVAFPEKYYIQIWPFISKIGGAAVIEDLGGFASKTKFFVYPVWQDDSTQETRFKLQYYGSVYKNGVELYKVYKRV
jgi:hypothetical protein